MRLGRSSLSNRGARAAGLWMSPFATSRKYRNVRPMSVVEGNSDIAATPFSNVCRRSTFSSSIGRRPSFWSRASSRGPAKAAARRRSRRARMHRRLCRAHGWRARRVRRVWRSNPVRAGDQNAGRRHGRRGRRVPRDFQHLCGTRPFGRSGAARGRDQFGRGGCTHRYAIRPAARRGARSTAGRDPAAAGGSQVDGAAAGRRAALRFGLVPRRGRSP